MATRRSQTLSNGSRVLEVTQSTLGIYVQDVTYVDNGKYGPRREYKILVADLPSFSKALKAAQRILDNGDQPRVTITGSATDLDGWAAAVGMPVKMLKVVKPVWKPNVGESGCKQCETRPSSRDMAGVRVCTVCASRIAQYLLDYRKIPLVSSHSSLEEADAYLWQQSRQVTIAA